MAQQYIGTARWGVQSTNTYTGTAGATTAISNGVSKARIMVTTDAYVTTDGTTPSVTSGAYMVAYQPEYVTVNPGQAPKAVQVTTTGSIYVTECL